VDLEAALRDLAPRVIRYCTGHMGDPSLGEEIAQESLAALAKSWLTSGSPTNPDAFVFAIAKRRVRRALFRRSLLLPLEHLLNHRHPGPDPERAAIANDQRTRLRSAIRRLPHAEREALLLVISGGQTVHEAAVATGISNSAMKMRLMRARQRLLVLVNDDYERRHL
jgi:RNA polymerase sigma-70 factor (ECF subfamily)